MESARHQSLITTSDLTPPSQHQDIAQSLLPDSLYARMNLQASSSPEPSLYQPVRDVHGQTNVSSLSVLQSCPPFLDNRERTDTHVHTHTRHPYPHSLYPTPPNPAVLGTQQARFMHNALVPFQLDLQCDDERVQEQDVDNVQVQQSTQLVDSLHGVKRSTLHQDIQSVELQQDVQSELQQGIKRVQHPQNTEPDISDNLQSLKRTKLLQSVGDVQLQPHIEHSNDLQGTTRVDDTELQQRTHYIQSTEHIHDLQGTHVELEQGQDIDDVELQQHTHYIHDLQSPERGHDLQSTTCVEHEQGIRNAQDHSVLDQIQDQPNIDCVQLQPDLKHVHGQQAIKCVHQDQGHIPLQLCTENSQTQRGLETGEDFPDRHVKEAQGRRCVDSLPDTDRGLQRDRVGSDHLPPHQTTPLIPSTDCLSNANASYSENLTKHPGCDPLSGLQYTVVTNAEVFSSLIHTYGSKLPSVLYSAPNSSTQLSPSSSLSPSLSLLCTPVNDTASSPHLNGGGSRSSNLLTKTNSDTLSQTQQTYVGNISSFPLLSQRLVSQLAPVLCVGAESSSNTDSRATKTSQSYPGDRVPFLYSLHGGNDESTSLLSQYGGNDASTSLLSQVQKLQVQNESRGFNASVPQTAMSTLSTPVPSTTATKILPNLTHNSGVVPSSMSVSGKNSVSEMAASLTCSIKSSCSTGVVTTATELPANLTHNLDTVSSSSVCVSAELPVSFTNNLEAPSSSTTMSSSVSLSSVSVTPSLVTEGFVDNGQHSASPQLLVFNVTPLLVVPDTVFKDMFTSSSPSMLSSSLKASSSETASSSSSLTTLSSLTASPSLLKASSLTTSSSLTALSSSLNPSSSTSVLSSGAEAEPPTSVSENATSPSLCSESCPPSVKDSSFKCPYCYVQFPRSRPSSFSKHLQCCKLTPVDHLSPNQHSLSLRKTVRSNVRKTGDKDMAPPQINHFDEIKTEADDDVDDNNEVSDHDEMISKDQFPCDKCSEIFETNQALKKHSHTHKNTENQCKVCGKTYTRINHLRRHDRSHAKSEKPLKCDICQKSFAFTRLLQEHVVSHAGDKAYSCDVCNTFCGSSGGLKEHKKTHAAPKHVCGVCNQEFRSAVALKKHKKTHGESGSLRPQNSLQRKRSVKGFKKTVKQSNKTDISDPKHFVCHVCGKVLKSLSSLLVHELTHREERRFKCNHCDRSFTFRAHLQRHQHVHTGVKDFSCDICLKTFITNHTLKLHFKNMHSGEKPFICDVCSQGFVTKHALKLHKIKHSDEKPYVCDVCNRGFRYECVLKNHKLLHTGHKPFKCDLCDKAYVCYNYLAKHKRVHAEPKFICDVCGKACFFANELKSHKLSHIDYKPYTCNTCSKAFPTVDRLKKHQLTHAEEKPFACNLCEKAFPSLGFLNKHIKKAHSEDQKVYTCKMCQRDFMRAETLRNHMNVHLGRKNFGCSDCGKSFHSLSSLKTHKKLKHTEVENKFVCKECGKTFAFHSYLKQHERVHSKEKSLVCTICNKAVKYKLWRHMKQVHNIDRSCTQ